MKSIFAAHDFRMAKPFAHLEGIQMKLDLGISPPRGVAGKAWSQPQPLPPAPQKREIVDSASPGGCGQNGIGLHDASGTLGTCQSCFAIVAASRIARPCCRTLPRTLLHEALVWVPDTCRDGPDSTSQPRGVKVQRQMQKQPVRTGACQTGCRGGALTQPWERAGQADAGCWPMDRDQPGEAFRRDETIAANTFPHTLAKLIHRDPKITPFYRSETEAQRLKSRLRS